MDQRLLDVLQHKNDNYILPFFWQRGDQEAVITEEIEKIAESGVKAFCVESRVHEDFCGERWWKDFGLILREAQKRQMKVWLLDDKRFPTGYANGMLPKTHPERRKWHILERHVDVLGPQPGSELLLNRRANDWDGYLEKYEESLLSVLAFRRAPKDEEVTGDPIDLTDRVRGQYLYWDVPEGCWRIFFLFRSRNGAGDKRDFISMIDPASVDVLLEAVYEPHFEHFGAHFGKTFAGFFSDEPCFGNTFPDYYRKGADFYNQTIGVPEMALPWSDEVAQRLEAALGENARRLLPGLWFDIGPGTPAVRLAYMDTVTRLYRDAFSRKLGDWCRSHGVAYIGHIIEDLNDHARLGSSAGHFFRALDGQDMSGVDVVKLQIEPGFGDYIHTSTIINGTTDPAFFDFVLAKLASSQAHIHPRMKGRAMCELFGDYGWAEGLPTMKWLTDHMLVRGINHFVPHAFSPAFPDPDCPPHFYARGANPQFRDFRVLMDYTNRMAHLLTGGRHVADAAVFYHAEAEWSGRPYMLTQVPAKLLAQAQIDYDILPADVLCDEAKVSNGRLAVQDETYGCLVMPCAELLPERVIRALDGFARQGLPILFVDGLPQGSTEHAAVDGLLREKNIQVVSCDHLVEQLRRLDIGDVRVIPASRALRVFHCVRGNSHVYMFFNEGLSRWAGHVQLPRSGEYLFLDLIADIRERGETDGGSLALELEPYQSCVFVFTEGLGSFPPRRPFDSDQIVPITGPWEIATAAAREYPDFTVLKRSSELFNVTGAEALPNFSGFMRYTAAFAFPHAASGEWVLNLGTVGETARVWLNGRMLGVRICPPYRFVLPEGLLQRHNRLEIKVANTLAFQVKDWVSSFVLLPPSGLLGPVTLGRRR